MVVTQPSEQGKGHVSRIPDFVVLGGSTSSDAHYLRPVAQK